MDPCPTLSHIAMAFRLAVVSIAWRSHWQQVGRPWTQSRRLNWGKIDTHLAIVQESVRFISPRRLQLRRIRHQW